MKVSFFFVFTLVLLSQSLFSNCDTTWADCGWGEGLTFTDFSLFPNPVVVGQTVHVRTVVSLSGITSGSIVNGSMSLDIMFNGGSLFTLTNIPLCNSTDAVICSALAPGSNTIDFDFYVPEIPAGTYKITVYPKPLQLDNAGGCISFDVTVTDPAQTDGKFQSWIEAQLAGSAQFQNTNYLDRTLGEIMQVGPIGPVPTVSSYTFQWGTFIAVDGSEDVIESDFDTTGYVWGMSGEMIEMVYYNTTRAQTYEGTFFVGYVSSLAKRTLDVSILDGRFNLTWNLATDANGVITSNLSGILYFDDIASLPSGWSHPITLGRFGDLIATTSAEGVLTISGTKNYCATSGPCVITPPPVNIISTNKSSNNHIGLIVGLCVGIPLLVLIIIALILWRGQRRRYEEEDGIFSAARKPEYGNALVVDDIIQETKEHGGRGDLIPRLDRRAGDTYSEYSSSGDELDRRPRSRDRGDDGSRSSRSQTSRSGSGSGSGSRSRSRSRSGPRYSENSESERSLSRGRPPADSDSYQSDAGSSASRATDES